VPEPCRTVFGRDVIVWQRGRGVTFVSCAIRN
jgi:hypothetical protein